MGEVVERVMRLGRALLRTQDEANGRILAGLDPVLARVIQVEVHLAGIGVAEAAHLQVDDHQTSEAPAEEHQIDPEQVSSSPVPQGWHPLAPAAVAISQTLSGKSRVRRIIKMVSGESPPRATPDRMHACWRGLPGQSRGRNDDG